MRDAMNNTIEIEPIHHNVQVDVARCDHEHVPHDKVGMCRRTRVCVMPG